MKRSSVTLENGIALKQGRGNQLLWRSRTPVWDRKPHRKGNEMLPGIYSSDPKYIQFLRDISYECDRTLKFEPTDEGFAGKNGVTGDFGRVRTISGYGMTPLTYLPRDNQRIADDLGLPSGFLKDRHRQIFDTLVTLMWGKYKKVNFRVPRDSSSGFPFFTTKDEEKLTLVRHALRHHKDILNACYENDLQYLAKDHAFVIAYLMNTRGQADTPGKERLVNDYEYARTGGASGRRFAADKTVVLNGQLYDDMSAMRMRTVCGMSLEPNALINVVQYGVRAHYAEEFAFTWHHTTQEQRLEKIRRFKFAVDLDVTNFDQSCQKWMIDYWIDKLGTYLSPQMIALYKLAHKAPYFQPSVDGEQPGRWIGNALDPSTFNVNAGLMSGIATVSDFGKLAMVFAYLCWIDDEVSDVIEFGIDKILKGEHPKYAMLDMGDDCRLLLNDARLRARLLSKIEEENSKEGPRSTYFKFDVEEGGSFIGDVIIRRDEQLDLVPSVISYLEKFFVAERGIDSKFRKFWPFGYFERKNLFGRAPAYDTVEDIVQFAWKRNFTDYSSINVIVDKFMQQTGMVLPSASSLADVTALLDPSKIHYSLNVSDLSDEVRDSIVMSIPFEDIEDVVNMHYSGVQY